MNRAVWAAAIAVLLAATDVRAGIDFAGDSQDWNGLAGLLAAAKTIDVTLRLAPELDFGQLDRHAVVLLLAPEVDPTAENLVELKAFLAAGGKLVVADDFRAGRSWVAPFGIDWLDQPGSVAAHYDGNRDLPIVHVSAAVNAVDTARQWSGPKSAYTPAQFLGHNLKHGVVLNHPAALRPMAATATAMWGAYDSPPRTGWLLEAARGRGRVLALADSSVFINQMVARVYDNRQFAANLLRYYCVEDRPCTVHVVANLRVARGAYADTPEDRAGWRAGLDWLSALLADLAELLQGKLVAPGLLALLLLLIGMPAVRRAQALPALLPPRADLPRHTSALSQKLQAWLGEPMADYRKPAQLLASQLERLLERVEPGLAADRARMAGAPQRRSGSWRRDDGLVEGLVRGGRWSPQAGKRLRQVLSDLQRLAQDHAPMVSRHQFGQLAAEVEWAETLLRHTVQRSTGAHAQLPSEASKTPARPEAADDATR